MGTYKRWSHGEVRLINASTVLTKKHLVIPLSGPNNKNSEELPVYQFFRFSFPLILVDQNNNYPTLSRNEVPRLLAPPFS